MFKKTVTYTNFNGDQVTRDFYFHLSKGELLEMGVSDMEERIRRMVATKDSVSILREFKAIVEMSVGIRSENGETFVKDDDAKATLIFSPAYDELLMELCTNPDAASHFINNLIPEKMRKELADQLAKMPAPAEGEDTRPAWQRENRKPTRAELQTMPREQMYEAFRQHPSLLAEKVGDTD